MILFETVCRGNQKSAWGVFGLFMGLALLGFLAMNFEIVKPVIAQVVMLVSLVAAAYVQIRFISTAFLYQAVREEEGDFLVISRRQGRKTVAACKLALAHLKWVKNVDTRIAPATLVQGVPVSNYSAYLLADTYTLAYFDDGAERVLVRFNADETFLSSLSAYEPIENGANEDTDEEAQN